MPSKSQVAPEVPSLELSFPCFVISISNMIEVCRADGVLPQHEELMAAGKLVKATPEMKILFLSVSTPV